MKLLYFCSTAAGPAARDQSAPPFPVHHRSSRTVRQAGAHSEEAPPVGTGACPEATPPGRRPFARDSAAAQVEVGF